jgi:hypothetical protein
MAEAPQNTPPGRDWRFPLTIGLSIGLALPTAQAVQKNLESDLGYWGAFALSIAAAAVVGGLGALVLSWIIKPGGPASKER